MPEVDFSRGIRPNVLAARRGDFKEAVFLDEELLQHFGSEKRVLEAPRMLVPCCLVAPSKMLGVQRR